MTVTIRHRTEGMRQARRVFRDLEALGEDPGELLDAIGQTLVESAVHRLAVSNEGPDGEKWPVSRRAQLTGGRTQYDRGNLANSILSRSLPNAIEVGSPLIYAAQRQFGGTIRPKNGEFLAFPTMGNQAFVRVREVTQPARPYLGISDEDADEIEGLALEFLTGILDEARP